MSGGSVASVYKFSRNAAIRVSTGWARCIQRLLTVGTDVE